MSLADRLLAAADRALRTVAASPVALRASPTLQSTLPEPELTDAVCRCIRSLLDTLKPEYAAALRRIDLDGLTPTDFSRETGITANNAAVRVHRARPGPPLCSAGS